MRVISGSLKGRRLQVPKGNRVRPTADRVKEALFSAITSYIGNFEGLYILDLFAGSGNLGIEALSRNALYAVFVDSHKDSVKIIDENLSATAFHGKAKVFHGDATNILDLLEKKQLLFDIIFIDPPYRETELISTVINKISGSLLMNRDAIIILETAKGVDIQVPVSLTLLKEKIYGDTKILMISPKNNSQENQ